MKAFTVEVPATSANLGPGFDCLGLALGLYNTIRLTPAESLQLQIEGEGATTLPRDLSNRVVSAMQLACGVLQKPLPNVRLQMTNRIPLARGLGSSAAAAVGGLIAANHCYGDVLTNDELLQLAVEIEGHPDNVAPALLGGLCVVNLSDGKPLAIKVAWPPTLHCIVFVPAAPLSTEKARSVVPQTFARADAVFNVGRAALFVAGITQQRFDVLRWATQDRIHQPYRAPLIAGFEAIIAAALAAGARGAFLSGAGSSIAALADGADDAIVAAMQRAADEAGQVGHVLQLEGAPHGAEVRQV